MEKQYAPSAKDKKTHAQQVQNVPAEAPKHEHKIEEKVEAKTEVKETKKKEVVKITPKESAVVNGFSLIISPKHSYAICKMIKGKSPERAIEMLEEVILKKRVVPMNDREIPHRKGDVMAGRYPLNASKEFIVMLKQLKANSDVNMVENPVIVAAIANRASRPQRRGGVRGKRTHVYMEVRNKLKLEKKK